MKPFHAKREKALRKRSEAEFAFPVDAKREKALRKRSEAECPIKRGRLFAFPVDAFSGTRSVKSGFCKI